MKGRDAPLSRELALALCAEVQRENRRRRFSFAAAQCWGCIRFTRGNPDEMKMSDRPGYRGCRLINVRYIRRAQMGAGG